MEKRRILWAIVFGSMLAITGCGDDASGNGGSAGSGGSGGSAGAGGGAGSGGSAGSGGTSGGGDAAVVCAALCGSCGTSTAECKSQCEDGFSESEDLDFDACKDELNALSSCVDGANSCLSFILECSAQYGTWITCVVDTGI